MVTLKCFTMYLELYLLSSAFKGAVISFLGCKYIFLFVILNESNGIHAVLTKCLSFI